MAKITISSLRHKVALCRAEDVVCEANGVMGLRRKEVLTSWAKIEPKKASTFSIEGFAVKEKVDTQTHQITIRFRRDLDISSAAWLYEQRLQSGDRWFKVLKINEVNEDGNLIMLSCRLVERGEVLAKPIEPMRDNLSRPKPEEINL